MSREEVDELLADLSLPGEVFGAIIAAAVQINETRGMVPGSAASVKWHQQRRMPLGRDGVLGVAEYASLLTPTRRTRPHPHPAVLTARDGRGGARRWGRHPRSARQAPRDSYLSLGQSCCSKDSTLSE
ncbi:hypothetical protein SVIO_098300 [Streptomyces violaceusniger]|uniref:Uncharacterized protein n=1 Tax=Streptomyces violaceusniger TaxID=68280 RepID=A0A4D4LLJ8_STRVO|nr:hypothetical protein SVIO_098300 [Streptomyces violaceusniger]